MVHCAGDVSFDPPIDQAFTTNVLGTKALMDRMIEACSDDDGNLVKVPHYVHISTAYTAGRRRGAIPEAPHVHSIDYEAETKAGLAMRDLIEAESRTSRSADRRCARRPSGSTAQAGYLTTAADTERRRLEWVQAELVKAGTERARSLGWTDVYTFTKALGERVVADVGAGVEVSVVRPAIVESSWLHPVPGVDRGLQDGRAADPGVRPRRAAGVPGVAGLGGRHRALRPRGERHPGGLRHRARRSAEPEYYHVSSGARNPLTFRDLYGHIREYFLEHPFEGGPRGAARLPQWQFPGAASVERLLSTSERAHRIADRLLDAAPRSSPDPQVRPATWTGPGRGSTSCAATSRSTTSTPSPSCTSSTTTRWP